ncbi:hypothetical protein AB0E96_37250, partial [Kitasatospora sp. NPDC036755]|uniref:hypothetical protein n=1 Tax=Kitasatospora sp. NPDC036755 TaxID=3154600 RepID=UPI0033D1EC4B
HDGDRTVRTGSSTEEYRSTGPEGPYRRTLSFITAPPGDTARPSENTGGPSEGTAGPTGTTGVSGA